MATFIYNYVVSERFNIQGTHSYKAAHGTVLVNPFEIWFIWPQLQRINLLLFFLGGEHPS